MIGARHLNESNLIIAHTFHVGFIPIVTQNLSNLIGIEGKEFEKGGAKGGEEVLFETESEENHSSVNSRATMNIGFAKVKSGGGFDRNRSKLGEGSDD